jgi:Fe-S oxidoreductase
MPFTEEDVSVAVRSCRFCPMCHHVDLVTAITRRETYSPRGRGMTLFAIGKGLLDWDAAVADVMYKFSADGLSRQVCAGHINHDEMVIDARQRLVQAGAAPESVAQVRRNIETFGNPWGETEPDLRALVGAESAPSPEVLVYFGATARVQRPNVVRSMVRLLRQAGISFAYLSNEGDPGLLLYQLGEIEAAQDAARRLQEKLQERGITRIVTPDAESYRVFKVGFRDYPGLGPGWEVQHVSELLESPARAGKLRFKRPEKRVIYHDPCALARFAPCLDPPRALLRAIDGEAPLELPWQRELAVCSGECGGLPFTNGPIARAAAAERLKQAREAGAEILVTSSPAAAQVMSDGGLEVKDLVEFAAECLTD